MPLQIRDGRYWDVSVDPFDADVVELTHIEALTESILNIFRVKYGDCGAIFRPNWGNSIHLWLHEPISLNTAAALKMSLIEDIRRNHGFVFLDVGQTQVVPVFENPPGFNVKIVFDITEYLENPQSVSFKINQIN